MRRVFSVIGLLAVLAAATFARAQQSGSDQAPPIPEGEVTIEADTFGFGGVVRAGEWMGLRLALTDRAERPRPAAITLRIPDADGDVARMQRVVTLNPGRTQGVWLYARAPFSTTAGSVFTVTAHARSSGADAETARGPQIGAARIGPSRVIERNAGAQLIGVIGRRRVGLDQYTVRSPNRSDQPATGHEPINLASGLTPEDFPDAWMGLAPYQTLVWVDGDPSSLRLDQAEAVLEWVRRGGHLVVVMPPVGQIWTNARANPLIDLVPAAEVVRNEGVNLERYRPMLTEREDLPLPEDAVLHTFRPASDASSAEAAPILQGPDSGVVAIRRLVGTGAVTFVGFDLTDRRLLGRLDAQRLWHRILGHRFDVISKAEAEQMQGAGDASFVRHGPVWLDEGIDAQINKTGRAGAGVLLGLVVFVIYFFLAGPLGFALLSKRGWRQHAWLAFIGSAAAFTLVAWGGARAIKPTQVDISHLTFLDHVYGQPVERARVWFNALLPTYGRQRVSIQPPEGVSAQDEQSLQALSSWDSPEADPAGFPDRREYAVNARRPRAIDAPTRSTVKQFRADWLGPPQWRMPRPVDGGGIGFDRQGGLRGSLVHDLPAPMQRVAVVLVRRQIPHQPLPPGGAMPVEAWAWKPFGSDEWSPGQRLDLSSLTYESDQRDTRAEQYFETLAASMQTGGLAGGLDRVRRSEPSKRFEMIAWHAMLEPPNWRDVGSRGKTLLSRRESHGWDLGRWFTQPCLIVVGQIAGEPSPIPIAVDGERPPSRGRTVLRWIYPLPPEPPSF